MLTILIVDFAIILVVRMTILIVDFAIILVVRDDNETIFLDTHHISFVMRQVLDKDK